MYPDGSRHIQEGEKYVLKLTRNCPFNLDHIKSILLQHFKQMSSTPEIGAALFRSPTSSSNSEANTEDGSLMEAACLSERKTVKCLKMRDVRCFREAIHNPKTIFLL